LETEGYEVPGLGMNIARYNIGGSGRNIIRTEKEVAQMKLSKNMPLFKEIQTFWRDWFDEDPNSTSWDWSVDVKQRTMLQMGKERGVNIIEAFSNSPPWWMNKNHATAGSDHFSGLEDNLPSRNHEKFAIYLATVAAYAQVHWNITFDYVEPTNEPNANFWKFPGKQEGCHFSVWSQISIVKHLRHQLNRMGLDKIGVTSADENSPGVALATLEAFSISKEAINALIKINTHGYFGLYPYRGPFRGQLYAATQRHNKKIWNSEYGENDATGITMAESISFDLNEMHVTAWIYWQILDSGGWGLVQSNPGDNWIGNANTKYYVLAQYSRHIRPGMILLGSGDKMTVAAYDSNRKLLVLVSVNTKESQTVTYDLSGFKSVSGPVNQWRTEATESSLVLYAGPETLKWSLSTDKKQLRVPFRSSSVNTLEIHGVEL
jgi:galactan endo-1,6-beta-galactosidase